MAIYHCSIKNISRSEGRSIVACAAYRAGEKLYCRTYGKSQDYTRKSGIEYSQIFAPDNVHPDLLHRQNLWNKVEQAELKKDGSIKQEARLAKEIEIALPFELDKAQRQTLVIELCQALVARHGVVVDVAIHAPHTAGGSDDRNFHAHILVTTRAATGQGLGVKIRELDKQETLKQIREKVAVLTNTHLERAGLDIRVDHRSHEEKGLDAEPTFHEGVNATHAKRKGIKLELVKRNDEIKQLNDEIKRIEHSIIETTATLEQLQQEQLERAVEEAPVVYATAQQALYDHQQHRQQLFDVYSVEVKMDEKSAEHRFYKALQLDIDRLQLDTVIKEGRAAEALLREIGEPVPPAIKIKKGWFGMDYFSFDELLKSWNSDQSRLAIYHSEIQDQRKEQQRQQEHKKLQMDLEAKREQENIEKERQQFELYLSYYGYVKNAEYEHIGEDIGLHLSIYTRLQARAYSDKNMQSFIKYSRQKYEHFRDSIRYEDIQIVQQVRKVLEKDRQALSYIAPSLMPDYEKMMDAFVKRIDQLQPRRSIKFDDYHYEQPAPKKMNNFDFD